MKAKHAVSIYGAISIVVLLLLRSGYGILEGWMILVGGSAGSLALAVEASSDILWEDLASTRHVSTEALAIFTGSGFLWVLGGFLLFRQFASRKRIVYRIAFVAVYLTASTVNLFLFAIRGV